MLRVGRQIFDDYYKIPRLMKGYDKFNGIKIDSDQ